MGAASFLNMMSSMACWSFSFHPCSTGDHRVGMDIWLWHQTAVCKRILKTCFKKASSVGGSWAAYLSVVDAKRYRNLSSVVQVFPFFPYRQRTNTLARSRSRLSSLEPNPSNTGPPLLMCSNNFAYAPRFPIRKKELVESQPVKACIAGRF